MAIYYKFFKTPPQPDGEEKYYLRAVSTSVMGTREAKNQIEKQCSLTAGDVDACLSALSSVIEHAIADGRRINLEGIGSFGPLVDGEVVRNEKGNLVPKNLRLRNITFTPERQLLGQLQSSVSIRRAGDAMGAHVTPTDEEVKQLLADYFKSHAFISSGEIMGILNLPRSSSYRIINRLETEGFLVRKAGVYVLANL